MHSAPSEQASQGPCAPESEAGVLGAMLQDAIAIAVAQDSGLSHHEFFDARNRVLCESAYKIFAAGEKVDSITLTAYLRREHLLAKAGGQEHIERVIAARVKVEHIESYIREVRDSAAKRLTLWKLQQLAQMSQNGKSPQEIADAIAETGRELAERFTEQTEKKQRFRLISAPDFKNRPKPQYLIENVLVDGTMSCLLGPPATYKSFVAISLAACVATGREWYGHKVLQRPVVYISGEGSAGLGHRQKAWEIANDTTLPSSCYFLPEAVQFHLPQELTQIIAAIRALPEPPGLIIIDTLARCLVGGDENSAKDMGMFIAGADRLRAETGAHILIVHHHNKEGKARGSSALPGALDTQIEVKRSQEHLELSCAKQKDAEEFEPIHLQRRIVELDAEGTTSLAFEAGPTAKGNAPSDQRIEAVLGVLREAGTGLRSTQWQELCEQQHNIKRRSFYNYKDELYNAGRIRQEGSHYVVAE